MKNPLLDTDFLNELCANHKEVFAKIIALTIDEEPVEEITGKITTGQVTVDGKSAVRRSCSLTLVAEGVNLHEYYWGLNTKFTLSVGLINNINPEYPEVVWMPQGMYLISTFSTSQNTNSCTISIQGKDKMCMLNGDIGGTITAISVDFGNETIIGADGSQTKKKLLIKDIIREVVHEYAQEPFHNIIINDLDEAALEKMEYRGDEDMYILYDLNADVATQFTLDKEHEYYMNENGKRVPVKVSSEKIVFDPRFSGTDLPVGTGAAKPTEVYAFATPQGADEHKYTIIRVQYGETIGYRITGLVYAGDLIGNVGDSITSAVLDKICQMLGNHEYFYNLDGQFVFQAKKTYKFVSWNNSITQGLDYKPIDLKPSDYYMNRYYYKDKASNTFVLSEDIDYVPDRKYYEVVVNSNQYFENSAYAEQETKIAYSFTGNKTITQIANNPNLANVRNDFAVWGVRTTSAGAQIPIHIRYAIDKKPVYYKSMDGVVFTSFDEVEAEDDAFIIAINKQIEELEKRKQEIEDAIYRWPKKDIPSQLQAADDGWWDVLDWAERFKVISGNYPTETINYYMKGNGGVQLLKLRTLFREPAIGQSYGYGYSGSSTIVYNGNNGYYGKISASTSPSTRCYIFDVNDRDQSLGYYGHLTGCNHKYSQFLNNYALGVSSYIYKPSIPTADLDTITKAIEELNQKAKDHKKEIIADRIRTNTDWREIIYQMGVDYMKYNHTDEFLAKLAENNREYYPTGYTGYEQYYTDIVSFWRDIYDPLNTSSYEITYMTRVKFNTARKEGTQYYFYENCADKKFDPSKTYWRLALDGKYSRRNTVSEDGFNEDKEHYYILRSILEDGAEFSADQAYYIQMPSIYDKSGWSYNVLQHPDNINFWFDFLDTEGDLSQYSVRQIGIRPKTNNDDKLKAIYFRDIPEVIFVNSQEELLLWKKLKQGYSFINVPGYVEQLFAISPQWRSCADVLDDLLYANTYCTEQIQITTLPIYYLQPNTRIMVHDDENGISGEYFTERLTIPLMYNSTMSITATKTVERIY